jgi:CxxC motif-containing protein (DUF1111 family)
LVGAFAGGCSDADDASAGAVGGGGGSLVADAPGLPVAGVSDAWLERFAEGDALFELPHREADGLGPLYIRQSCAACHTDDVRGPGFVEKMVVVEQDGVTPAADQSALPFGHTVRPYVAADATTPLLPPSAPGIKITRRVGPPVVGRGYIEAIRADEIERVEAEQAARTDGIHGRINRVTYVSEANPDVRFFELAPGQGGLIGRFGLKARQPSLDDFTADAFQGDMGLTTIMRPTEPPNPDGVLDDLAAGVDVPIDDVNLVADYMRLLAIPPRAAPEPGAEELFAEARCSVCHVPSLRTRADYPIVELADVDAAVYTDLLLHDLGDALADGLAVEGEAGSRDWRTAPLIGLRFNRTFLHDGRARSISEAILAHGGEAADSVERYQSFSAEARERLDTFVLGL